jgi:1-acyl-sn-glycerol-3-phosphate acyltransferase
MTFVQMMAQLTPVPTWLMAAIVVVGLFVAGYAILAMTFRTRLGAWICYQLACLFGRFRFHWKSQNPCPIPESGPAIIVANHTSPTDPVILWIKHFASFRRPRLRVIGYMTAKEYCDMWGPVGWICRAMQSIPVARSGRDMAPVKLAYERLKAGHLVGLFPEGRINVRSPSGKLLRAGTGAAWLALKSHAPVIPIYIRDAPRSESMVQCFLKATQTTVIYGEPLDLSQWLDQKPTRAVLAEMTNHIMSELARLGGVEYTPVTAESARHGEEETSEATQAESHPSSSA